MIDLHQIRNNIGNMDDLEILRKVSAGREVYIDGVYNLYLQEAIQRDLDISESNIEHIQFQIAMEEHKADKQYFTNLGWHSYFSTSLGIRNVIINLLYIVFIYLFLDSLVKFLIK